ncbi:penicillin-binding protein activator [Flexibacterium corallicola]|uniref:penicillin-binding protein activator n=1 Tax=Flexibacterium corallicola TaxID=3037259 RepID=UPI00286F2AE0|nr:penicillin-binding protein activator [Pseudovibrio sp. M1P-2-3]
MTEIAGSSKTGLFKGFITSLGVGAMLFLGSCVNSSNYTYSSYSFPKGGEEQQPTGQVIGEGSVRVAMLLPFSGEGASASSVANLFRNTAELALSDFQDSDIQLIIKDSGGTTSGGQAAARAAVQEGAELIIGPVFANAVRGASPIARGAGVPIIAFSTDTNVASQGTYLLSYLPQSDTKRVVDFAIEQERRSFAALLPNNSYGAVVEAAFRQAVGSANGRIVSIERYTPGNVEDIRQKTTNISGLVSQVDTLFIPEGGGVPSYAMQVMTEVGANIGELKLIGSGLWNTPDVLRSPVLVGAWFPGPDNRNFDDFSNRYAQTYGSAPARNASLAYDAMILAAGLVRTAGVERFSEYTLTSRDGFLGVDGVFRFDRNGNSERGLAVYTITQQGKAETVSTAQRSFSY